jgi:hypothetical protein
VALKYGILRVGYCAICGSKTYTIIVDILHCTVFFANINIFLSELDDKIASKSTLINRVYLELQGGKSRDRGHVTLRGDTDVPAMIINGEAVSNSSPY